MTNSKELLIADVLSDFTDLINQGAIPSLDEYAARYSTIATELRPLLESIIQVRRETQLTMLSKAASDSIFARIQETLSTAGQTWPAISAKVIEQQSTEALPQAASITKGIQIDKRPDFLILLLHFMGEIWGKTKLIKLLFLLGKEGHCDQFVTDFYNHYAYNYGAFDKSVPQDVQALAQNGILNQKNPPVKRKKQDDLGIAENKQVDAIYELTPKGKKFALRLLEDAQNKNPEIIKRIQEIVQKYGKKTGEELIDYTYNTYPETAENSKVRDKYLKKKPNTPPSKPDEGTNV